MKTFRLELTEGQAAALVQACEALARIGLGQFDAAILDHTSHMPQYMERRADAGELLDQVTEMLGLPEYTRRGGPSISNPKVPPYCRQAWDIAQVVRYELARFDLPGGRGAVCKNTPLRCGPEPLPTIALVEPEGEAGEG